MADMEMDLDTRNHGDAVDAHDDPIDYDLDIDITNNHEPGWEIEDIEIQEAADELPEMNVQMEGHDDVDHDIPSDAMDTLEAGVTAGVAKSDADMLSNVDPNEITTMDQAVNEEEMMPGDVEHVAIVETTMAAPEVSEEAPVDSEYLELSGDRAEEPEEITYEEAEPVKVEDAGAAPNTEDAAPVVVDDAAEPQEPAVAQGKKDDNDELTWEEDDADTEQHALASQQPGEEATEVNLSVQPPGNSDQQIGDEQDEPEENEEVEHSETQEHDFASDADDPHHEKPQPDEEVPDALNGVQEAAETVKVEDQPVTEEVAETTGDDGIENDVDGETANEHAEGAEALSKDGYWPAITVQYKGEEFPCFAAADGFFTETSVVEESMERVLAGLRQELSAELAEDEELVFHVDELGLEFAESTQRELLTTTTLRSILDLYEMLIQNQDQDAHAKPLYTYLLTRSSPSKRLEYLMESAANGRGLDEVIHLFEPAILHSHETSHDGESDVLDDDHDEYPSPGDELQPDGEEASATYGVDHVPTNEEVGTGTVDHNDSSTDHHESGGVAKTYDKVGDGTSDEAVIALEDHVEEVDVEANNSHPENENSGLHGGEGEFTQDDTEQHQETFQVIDDQNRHVGEQISATNMYHERENDAENAAAKDTAVDTSATSTTLDGTEIAADDLTYDEQPSEDAQATHEAEDDHAEIDWKDDDDEDTAAVAEQSPPAKRTRTEDELDDAEENDTKRQRSS